MVMMVNKTMEMKIMTITKNDDNENNAEDINNYDEHINDDYNNNDNDANNDNIANNEYNANNDNDARNEKDARNENDANNDVKVDLPGDIGALAALEWGKTKSSASLRIFFIVLSPGNHHRSGRFGLLTAEIEISEVVYLKACQAQGS